MNFAIDDRLLAEAQRIGRHRTKSETVAVALTEYIARRKQRELLALFGTIEYDSGYYYKSERRAKCRDSGRVMLTTRLRSWLGR